MLQKCASTDILRACGARNGDLLWGRCARRRRGKFQYFGIFCSIRTCPGWPLSAAPRASFRGKPRGSHFSPVSLNWFRPSPAGPSESSFPHGRRSRNGSHKLTSARKSEGRIEEIANISFQCRPPRYGRSSPFGNRFRPRVPGCAVARRFCLPRVPCSRGGPA